MATPRVRRARSREAGWKMKGLFAKRKSAAAPPPAETTAAALPVPEPTAAERAWLAALPGPAVLTRDEWTAGGVEILAANPAFAALTLHPAEALAGANTRLLHGRKTEAGAGKGPGPAPGEAWLYRADGTEFFARWRFAPWRPGVWLGQFDDCSEVKHLQEALLHSQKLDAVGELAGGMAHDFNNLLSIINGYCEILGPKLAGQEAATHDLGEILRAGLRAAVIARQILEFSRRQETEARVVNPNTLIREIADILRRVLGEGVQVELRLASDLGNVRLDPTQFQQALLNLCFNARDALPAGGRFTLRTRGAPGPRVLVQVADTGVGMDEAVRRRVFEPFYTTKPHGTGLGLAMVCAFVRQSGGAIAVRSAPGEGTTFELTFPETAEPEQVFSTALAPLPATGGSETVWWIESDEVLRKMVAGILAVDGYRVREFARPAEALADAEGAEPPQLLLLDCGAEQAARLAHRLREANPRLKVLGVSVASPAAALPDFPAKALGHLPKPFALSTLLRAVRGMFDGLGR